MKCHLTSAIMLAEEWGNMDLVFSYTFVKPLHILLHKGSPLFFTLGTMVFGFHASPFMGKQFFFCLKSDWIIIIQMWLFLVRSPFHCRNIVTLNSRNMKSFETVIPVYWMFLWVFFFFCSVTLFDITSISRSLRFLTILLPQCFYK